MNSKDWWFVFGAMLVLVGAVLQIAGYWLAPYIVGIGGIAVFLYRLITAPKTDNFRVRRLMRMQLISSFLLIVSAYFMYTNDPKNVWALTLFLAAFLDIFIMIRLPRDEERK